MVAESHFVDEKTKIWFKVTQLGKRQKQKFSVYLPKFSSILFILLISWS